MIVAQRPGPRSAAGPVGALALAALALAGAVACHRGPSDEALRAELAARLDAEFSDGLFALRDFRRVGSAPAAPGGAATAAATVYYRAELEFRRDYELAAWRGLNLGTLAMVLGATPAGIEGFVPRGNREGDRLQVRGRMAWSRAEDGWQARRLSPTPEEPEEATVPTLEGSAPDAVLRQLRALVDRQTPLPPGSRDRLILRELRRSLAGIDLALARRAGEPTLGSGPIPGTYHRFGEAFADFARSRELPLLEYPSEGSVENASRVHSGELRFALVQSDVAEALYAGGGPSAPPPMPDLRSMASLWPEALHVVCFDDAGIETLGDLRGRRIAIGARGSGSRFSASRILRAVGLVGDSAPATRAGDLRESIAALEAGEVDALFLIHAVPAPPLQELVGRRPDARLVPLDAELVERLSEEVFAYYPLSIAARSYPGQEIAVPTLGTAALLVTHREAPEGEVESVLELLLDGADELARDFYRAAFISPDTARLGIALPLHRAAERFYARLEASEP